MIMGYLTSGNIIVDAMGSINITGNIIPAVWYRTITKENGKPYLLAIVILADIVYWLHIIISAADCRTYCQI